MQRLTIGDLAYSLSQYADLLAAYSRRLASTDFHSTPEFTEEEKAILTRLSEEILLARDFFNSRPPVSPDTNSDVPH